MWKTTFIYRQVGSYIYLLLTIWLPFGNYGHSWPNLLNGPKYVYSRVSLSSRRIYRNTMVIFALLDCSLIFNFIFQFQFISDGDKMQS